MWYRIKLGVVDAAMLPLRTDRLTREGPCLEDLVAEIAVQLVCACDQARSPDQRFLKMYLAAGLEIEQWTSQTDFLRHDGATEGFRRAMRNSVMRCPSSLST